MSPSPSSAQGPGAAPRTAVNPGAALASRPAAALGGGLALPGDSVASRLHAWGHWLRSWLRPTLALYLPADQPEQAFDAWCRTHPGVPVRLLLAGGLTHQAVQPSPAAPAAWASWGSRSAATQSARATQDWAQHYGPQAHAWPLATWRGAGREGSVALHGASLAALQRSAQACGVRLRAVVPLWAALLPWADARQPQWWCAGPRPRLAPSPAAGTGTGNGTGATDAPTAALAVVEGALLTWVQCSPVGVREVLQRRLGAPTAEALEQKIHSLRAPQQRVLVVGFGLDAGSAAAAQAAKATQTSQTTQATQVWQVLTPLDASALPGPVLQALATPPWARRAARRWPTPDVLLRPGSLGVLGRCLVLLAWLGLAGSAALWQHSHANFTQALHQRDAAAASLQSARLAQPSTPPPVAGNASGTGAGAGAGTPRTARAVQPGGTPADVHLQARKVMAGLRYAWAGLLLPIEAAASGNVRWLELDCSTEGGPAGGRVRLLGQASTTAAALDAVQTLSAQKGWSQVVLSKVQDTSARDPQGGVRFELTALYRSLPPAPATEAQ